MKPSLMLIRLHLLLFLTPIASGCGPSANPEVVVYTSQDRTYAEPVLQEFTKSTGIQVKSVFDSEAVKTVGIANRLTAEKDHPRCDLFWNNESFRTQLLAAKGILSECTNLDSIPVRHRRIVINTNRVSLAEAPKTLAEFAKPAWKGKLALAYPLFGTTGSHFLFLREQIGFTGWSNWCQSIRACKPMILDGNSLVAKMVGLGQAWIGITDSDDIRAEQMAGAPIASLAIADHPMPIASSIAFVTGKPLSPSTQKLASYLGSRQVSERLVASGAFDEVVTRESTSYSRIQGMISAQMISRADESIESLRIWFAR